MCETDVPSLFDIVLSFRLPSITGKTRAPITLALTTLRFGKLSFPSLSLFLAPKISRVYYPPVYRIYLGHPYHAGERESGEHGKQG